LIELLFFNVVTVVSSWSLEAYRSADADTVNRNAVLVKLTFDQLRALFGIGE
jgi:hypothetical protein